MTLEAKTGGSPVQQRVTYKGWVELDGKRFYVKSRYEKRYALYLSFMKKHGHIVDYDYEPETFWFNGIKRGVVSYKPDFKVVFPSGNVEYYEIKGYMTAQDRTKLKRMAKYYPDTKISVIDKEWYKTNGKILRKVLPDW